MNVRILVTNAGFTNITVFERRPDGGEDAVPIPPGEWRAFDLPAGHTVEVKGHDVPAPVAGG